MLKRSGFNVKGVEIPFHTDGKYFKPNCDTKDIFNGWKDDLKYCVLYTILRHDKGEELGLFGFNTYDNGIIGYQCMSFYEKEREARKALDAVRKLTPKGDMIDYVDIWLAKKK